MISNEARSPREARAAARLAAVESAPQDFDLRRELGLPGGTQDPTWRSWRVWGSFWAAVAGILSVPEVQSAITVAIGAAVPVAYAPLVPGALAVIWPLVSKVRDHRPVSGQDGAS